MNLQDLGLACLMDSSYKGYRPVHTYYTEYQKGTKICLSNLNIFTFVVIYLSSCHLRSFRPSLYIFPIFSMIRFSLMILVLSSSKKSPFLSNFFLHFTTLDLSQIIRIPCHTTLATFRIVGLGSPFEMFCLPNDNN